MQASWRRLVWYGSVDVLPGRIPKLQYSSNTARSENDRAARRASELPSTGGDPTRAGDGTRPPWFVSFRIWVAAAKPAVRAVHHQQNAPKNAICRAASAPVPTAGPAPTGASRPSVGLAQATRKSAKMLYLRTSARLAERVTRNGRLEAKRCWIFERALASSNGGCRVRRHFLAVLTIGGAPGGNDDFRVFTRHPSRQLCLGRNS